VALRTQTEAVTIAPRDAAARERPRERSHWRLAGERFLQHRLAVASIFVLAAMTLVCAFAPTISPYDPEKPQLLLIHEPPTLEHPMGTDALGRDLATRVLYGGRVSLSVGVLAMAVAISIGTLIGGLAGFYGRWLDGVLMRFVDMMYAFPRLFLLIILGVLFKGMTVAVIVILLGALSWMTAARLVRAAFLSLREREFVEAARCIGARDSRIILRHILPNSLAPIIVAGTLGIAGAIIAESTLSFLGLGIQPPTPSWGNMLEDATTEMERAWWTAFFPGFVIFLAVVSINFIGDGLRDALDPRHTTRAN
jgi:peptide/nickel transport system permease protein